MQEDANPDCKECNGEGEVYQWFAHDKQKLVAMDWTYCNACFPGNSCVWEYDICEGWRFIDYKERDELIKQGYKKCY